MTKLKDTRPELEQEWDLSLNTAKFTEVSSMMNAKVFWVCKKGHKWAAPPASRSRGSGCPYCANKKVMPGYNDLATTHPDLAKELEEGVLVTFGSSKKVPWICSKGHRWEASVNDRTNSNSGCPYCSGHKVITGKTDLLSQRPDIAGQWAVSNSLNPDSVSVGSKRKALWECEQGHEVASLVKDSTTGHGCPKCVHHISAGEQALYEYLKSILKNTMVITQSRRDIIPPKEIDIFIEMGVSP